MGRYRVTYKTAQGDRQYVTLLADSEEDAEAQAEAAQAARKARFPLTFARLEQAAETGDTGMLAIDPRLGGSALAEAWVQAEMEKRKYDQARYEDGTLEIESVEELD